MGRLFSKGIRAKTILLTVVGWLVWLLLPATLGAAGGAFLDMDRSLTASGRPSTFSPLPLPDSGAIQASRSPSLYSTQHSPFQQMFGSELLPFGYDLFTHAPPPSSPGNLSIPMDYTLGPGDELLVRTSADSQRTHTLIVDREGFVRLPGMAPLAVSGMGLSAVRGVLEQEIRSELPDQELIHLAPGALRPIRIFILGEVRKAGAYPVPALSTMTEALARSGGIKPIGSLRQIQLKRRGRVIGRLDLYDLLLRGDTRGDLRLQGGDVIFVPPLKKAVGVSGEVMRPGIYELVERESVGSLLTMAGGLLPTSYPTQAKLTRIDPSKQRVQLDLDLERRDSLSTSLKNGDLLNVLKVLEEQQQVVTLAGQVQRPGSYQWRHGQRLVDVIDSRDDLKPGSDLSYVLINRINPSDGRLMSLSAHLEQALADPSSEENIYLHPRDKISVFALAEDRTLSLAPTIRTLKGQARGDLERLVSISGHVKFPGEYPYHAGMDLATLMDAAGGLLPGVDREYGLIVRMGTTGGVEPFSVRPEELLNGLGGEEPFPLEVGDRAIFFPAYDPPSRGDVPESSTDSLLSGGAGLSRTLSPVVRPVGLQPSRVMSQSGANDRSQGHVAGRAPLDPLVLQSAERFDGPRGSDSGALSRQRLLAPVLDALQAQASRSLPSRVATITGAVRSPGAYPLEEGMRVSDLIRAGGGLAEPASPLAAELTHYTVTVDEQGVSRHQEVDLAAILSGDPAADMELQPHDVLEIRTISHWGSETRVGVWGEVDFPKGYTLIEGESIQALIARAGGLTSQAFPEGAIFLRASLREQERMEIDALIERLEAVLAEAPSVGPGAIDRGRVAGLIEKWRRVEPQGRLAIDLPGLLKGEVAPSEAERVADEEWAAEKELPAEVILRHGDALIIPKISNEVRVLGEVNRPTSHLYQPGRDLADYLELSGGMTPLADKYHAFIVKANGQIAPQGSNRAFGPLSWFFLGPDSSPAPGDTIVVPMDLSRILPDNTLSKEELTRLLLNQAVTQEAFVINPATQ
ncbi:MAG: SLBB domain-containing protein [Magnetococcales bacterium]|nr:SLBB domain-containing protein [Magnetococcales bacterium]